MTLRGKSRRFVSVQVALGAFLTFLFTYVSLAVADHVGTPQVLRYIFSPGFVVGMRFASGSTGFLESLGSFGRIAITVNLVYYGCINLLLFWKVDWPKFPKNSHHHFWMER